MSVTDICIHSTVVRCMDPYKKGYIDLWVCDSCGSEYGPLAEFGEEVAALEEQSNQVIDMVAGVFSTVLWDLHQRARQAGQVDDAPEERPIGAAICEEKGHERGDDGVCTRCGDSPFLGGPDNEGDR